MAADPPSWQLSRRLWPVCTRFCEVAAVVSAYNHLMRRVLSFSFVFVFFLYSATVAAVAQTSNSAAATGASAAERAINLAESGRCAEALPLLKRTIRQTTDKELQKRAGLVGMHCAMT